jgi:hypothetical protein
MLHEAFESNLSIKALFRNEGAKSRIDNLKNKKE